MAASDPLFTREELESRVGKITVNRVLSQGGGEEADEDAVDLVIADANTWIRGKLGPVFDFSTLDDTNAGDLKRIALDVARAYLCERHPEVMRQDASKIFDRCAKDIKAIRMGEANLGTGAAPDPAANHGATSVSGNPDDPDCIPRRFSDNWGDFG